MAGRPRKNRFDNIEIPQSKEEMAKLFDEMLAKEQKKLQSKHKRELNSFKKEIDKSIAEKISQVVISQQEEMDKITAEKDAEILKLQEKQVHDVIPSSNSSTEYIPLDLQVNVRSNVDGKYILSENKGSINYFIPFGDYGDTTTLTYKELKSLSAFKPRNVRDGMIAITGAYTPDGQGYDIDKVLKDLRIYDMYNDPNRVSPLEIDYILSNKCDLAEFRTKLSNSAGVGQIILEVASRMKKRGRFNDVRKIEIFRELFGDSTLFR